MSSKKVIPLQKFADTLIEGMWILTIIDDLETHKVKNINNKKFWIYRASIIHFCAAIEVFAEASVEEALKCVLEKSKDTSRIPPNLLLRVSDRLFSNQNKKDIWKISGDGWKSELMGNFTILKEKFNTPRPNNIDDFVYKTIGLKNLSHSWSWKAHPYNKSCEKLDEFMNLRGGITHKLITKKRIHRTDIYNYINFLYRVSVCSSNKIRNHTHSVCGTYPWDHYPLRNIL